MGWGWIDNKKDANVTTNVFDAKNKILASDSRWSIGTDFAIIYVDDTDFDKVAIGRDLSFTFAGNAQKIGEWKKWLTSTARMVQEFPSPEGISICAVEMVNFEMVFKRGQQEVEDAFFAGTGTEPASVCWKSNKDARRSVETAKMIDRYSGGNVKYFEMLHNSHNLSEQVTYECSIEKLKERGIVMYHQQQQTVSLKEASANDPRVAAITSKIMSGEVSLNAPCPSVHTNWSEQEKESLKNVLSKYLSK